MTRLAIPVGMAALVLLAGALTAPAATAAGPQVLSRPVINKVEPNVGPTVGHQRILVTGHGFTGMTSAQVGGRKTRVVRMSDHQFAIFTPAHAVGSVDVRVTTAGGTSAPRPEDVFTYRAPTTDYPLAATITGPVDPWAIAVNSATGIVYACNYAYADGHGLVSVIDEASNSVTATVQTDHPTPNAIAVNPSTNMIYVAAMGFPSSTVTVIDGATNAVVTTLTLHGSIVGMDVDATTNTVYVSSSDVPRSKIYVIDGATNAVTGKIVTPDAASVAADPTTGLVYGAVSAKNIVLVIDGATRTIIDSIQARHGARGLVVDPAAQAVFVLGLLDGNQTVGRIDAATRHFTAVTPIAPRATDLALDPTSHSLYVTTDNESRAYVLDEGDLSVTNIIPTADRASRGVDVDTMTHRVFVTHGSNNNVAAFTPTPAA